MFQGYYYDMVPGFLTVAGGRSTVIVRLPTNSDNHICHLSNMKGVKDSNFKLNYLFSEISNQPSKIARKMPQVQQGLGSGLDCNARSYLGKAEGIRSVCQ